MIAIEQYSQVCYACKRYEQPPGKAIHVYAASLDHYPGLQ